jgi:hypothetical protein
MAVADRDSAADFEVPVRRSIQFSYDEGAACRLRRCTATVPVMVSSTSILYRDENRRPAAPCQGPSAHSAGKPAENRHFATRFPAGGGSVIINPAGRP